MTAKNAGSTILHSIQSTLRALSDDSELLVLVDGGDDDTPDIVSKIQDKRLKLNILSESVGRSAGRNLLAREARNEYLAVTDADDIDLPWRFKMLQKYLVENDAVFANPILFGKPIRTGVLPAPPIGLNSDQIRGTLIFKNPLIHSTSIFSKELFFDMGMYGPFDLGEDYDLWLRMATNGVKMRRVAGYGTLYRQHPKQSIRSSGFTENIENNKNIREKRIGLARLLGFDLEFDKSGRIENEKDALNALCGRDYKMRYEAVGLPPKIKSALKGYES
jgi:glycosyltransferase involved in cell wall biosynthesis